MKAILALGIFAVAALPLPGQAAPVLGLAAAAKSLVAGRCLADLDSGEARKSIRGTTALWTELSLQEPGASPALGASLALDLKVTDLEGQLRDAGIKVMDPKKRSLAMGLRPTLVLSLLYAPKGSEGNVSDFYVVTVRATQDVTPLGGPRVRMTTWLKSGGAIQASGDPAIDAEAIRASARASVLAFIGVAQDHGSGPDDEGSSK
jgi:hypothetical protein